MLFELFVIINICIIINIMPNRQFLYYRIGINTYPKPTYNIVYFLYNIVFYWYNIVFYWYTFASEIIDIRWSYKWCISQYTST